MADEPQTPDIEALKFTQYIVREVESWPARTAFSLELFQAPHLYDAKVQGDDIVFEVFNGTATYRLTGETLDNGAKVAEKVDGKKTSRKVKTDG